MTRESKEGWLRNRVELNWSQEDIDFLLDEILHGDHTPNEALKKAVSFYHRAVDNDYICYKEMDPEGICTCKKCLYE